MHNLACFWNQLFDLFQKFNCHLLNLILIRRWNSLLAELRQPDIELEQFKRLLKMFFFGLLSETRAHSDFLCVRHTSIPLLLLLLLLLLSVYSHILPPPTKVVCFPDIFVCLFVSWIYPEV